MSTVVTTRDATSDDAARVADIINAAFSVERFFKAGDRTSIDEVRRLLNDGTFIVAAADGAIVGTVYIDTRNAPAYLGLLAIDPARQGERIGTALMDVAEQRCRERGATSVQIRVVNLREELPPFYRRRGYVERGTAPFPLESARPCHFIVMEKPLGAASRAG